MKFIILSGVSACGKTSIIEKLKMNGINTYEEIKSGRNLINHFYQISTTKDQNAKNIFLINNMIDKMNVMLSCKEFTVFDRGIVDYMVAAKLRIKPNDKKFYDFFEKEFINAMKIIQDSNIVMEYIILNISFDTFKNRLIKRGREHEVNNLLNDDSWYKNYFNEYNKILEEILIDYKINYKYLDVDSLNENEAFVAIQKLIKK